MLLLGSGGRLPCLQQGLEKGVTIEHGVGARNKGGVKRRGPEGGQEAVDRFLGLGAALLEGLERLDLHPQRVQLQPGEPQVGGGPV